MKKNKFKADVCVDCTQTKNYLLCLDKGAALILLGIANAVDRLGRNRVHLQKEVEGNVKDFGSITEMINKGYLTSVMVGNATRARYHGLIAFVERDGGTGEYLLTKKGAAFLRGARVPRAAIIDKVAGHNAGYWDPENDTVTIFQLLKESKTWIIPTFEIPAEGTFQPALAF